jgi:hypothetical protein
MVVLEMGKKEEVSQSICPGWPRILILLISISEIVRITGVSPVTLSLTMEFGYLLMVVPQS